LEIGPQVRKALAEIDPAGRTLIVSRGGFRLPLSADLRSRAMRIAIVITTEGRSTSTDHLVQSLREHTRLPHDIHVVDHSVDPSNLSSSSNFWFPDRHGRGEVWVQCTAMNAIRTSTAYDYVWFLNDEFAVRTDTDPVGQLVEIMEKNPKMAMLCPSDPTGEHPGSMPQKGIEWHAATDTPHVGFMVRCTAVDEVGFLNPKLRYCVGASIEFAYNLYTQGWFVAYADTVRAHQPASIKTPPGQDPARIQAISERFAFDYMFSNYGWEWSTAFSNAAAGHEFAVNGFMASHGKWSKCFTADELEIRRAAVADEAPLLQGNPVPPTEVQPTAEVFVEENQDVVLHSDAQTKLLVWPKYDSAEDLEIMLSEYGRLLINRPDICLCVRHDPERDVEINAACAAMALVHERLFGPDVDLHILLVNDEIPADKWWQLGEAVDGSLVLPSAHKDAERAAFHEALQVQVFPDVVALRNAISAPSRIPSLEDLFPGMEQLAG